VNSYEETCSRLLCASDEGKVSGVIVLQISCGLLQIIVGPMCASGGVIQNDTHEQKS
jgi:hypothetical protein